MTPEKAQWVRWFYFLCAYVRDEEIGDEHPFAIAVSFKWKTWDAVTFIPITPVYPEPMQIAG